MWNTRIVKTSSILFGGKKHVQGLHSSWKGLEGKSYEKGLKTLEDYVRLCGGCYFQQNKTGHLFQGYITLHCTMGGNFYLNAIHRKHLSCSRKGSLNPSLIVYTVSFTSQFWWMCKLSPRDSHYVCYQLQLLKPYRELHSLLKMVRFVFQSYVKHFL